MGDSNVGRAVGVGTEPCQERPEEDNESSPLLRTVPAASWVPQPSGSWVVGMACPALPETFGLLCGLAQCKVTNNHLQAEVRITFQLTWAESDLFIWLSTSQHG